ncbi:MAG: hypothetical protein ABS41_09335 [Arenimonas sp. SCN 70-307]|uniref:DUF3703 domain-containing protein n=1 Tax=Arenimonas sp. SCN 70-307 TaxID=1660089 RepID=UPI00086F9541|nr:DUF3703 domain-containing protein [Arenimonas sp. SCN 70-307]ODS62546.1 MAG: hypothetical protein ABS41_09335 [Arenimonas sp. SCN 70-307]
MTRLAQAFTHEWNQARAARLAGDLDRAFHHLERAHILGQRHTRRHIQSHLGMLHVGWLRSDLREMAGQLARIVAATLFSRIWVPVGNTGGANVSALQPMPVPPDLQALLDES